MSRDCSRVGAVALRAHYYSQRQRQKPLQRSRAGPVYTVVVGLPLGGGWAAHWALVLGSRVKRPGSRPQQQKVNAPRRSAETKLEHRRAVSPGHGLQRHEYNALRAKQGLRLAPRGLITTVYLVTLPTLVIEL